MIRFLFFERGRMYKQIIIARKDLNMSAGKLAAQVSHGSMAFMTKMIKNNTIKVCVNDYNVYDSSGNMIWYRHPDLYDICKIAKERGDLCFYAEPEDPSRPYGKQIECEPKYEYVSKLRIDNGVYEHWIKDKFTKCVLQAKNKNQLLKAKKMAEELGMSEGIDFFLINDMCLTEIEPENEDGTTLTCIGFRPMDAEVIDKIGKKFHLYT